MTSFMEFMSHDYYFYYFFFFATLCIKHQNFSGLRAVRLPVLNKLCLGSSSPCKSPLLFASPTP